jgi:acylphosphatase
MLDKTLALLGVFILVLSTVALAGCGATDTPTLAPEVPTETEMPPTDEVEPVETEPPAAGGGIVEMAYAWYGYVIGLPGNQYDDLLFVHPDGMVQIGIEGETAAIEDQIVALRDQPESSRNAHFWGIVTCPVLDYGECQLRVTRVQRHELGTLSAPEAVEGWEGTFFTGRTEPGSGGDDYFQLDGEFPIQYGNVAAIGTSGERELQPQIESLRDTGTKVRIWGSLVAGIPDWNGTQIEVTRIELIDEPPAVETDETAFAWYGQVIKLPVGSQHDDYLSVNPDGIVEIGIEGETETIEQQIVALRDGLEANSYANFWGKLICPALDYGGCELRVTRMRVSGPGPFFDPDPVEGWEGTIVTGRTEPGSGGDDYFLLEGDYPIQYGITAFGPSGNPELEPQIVSLRDTGTRVRIWGSLMAGIPDWNLTQIVITRIEFVGN